MVPQEASSQESRRTEFGYWFMVVVWVINIVVYASLCIDLIPILATWVLVWVINIVVYASLLVMN